jgi:hypothetical protein
MASSRQLIRVSVSAFAARRQNYSTVTRGQNAWEVPSTGEVFYSDICHDYGWFNNVTQIYNSDPLYGDPNIGSTQFWEEMQLKDW